MIKRFFSVEYAKLKEMNFTDKRQYIWEYYKLHIFFIGVAVFITGSLINVWFINPPKRDYLYIAWQAGPVPIDPLDELGARLNVIVENQDRYQVSVRSYTLTEDPQMNQALITRFHALLSMGDIHAIISTSQGIQESAEFGIVGPPDEVLDILRQSNPPLYGILSEKLLTITFSPGEDLPDITDVMAISLSNAPLFTEVGFVTDDLYLGVMSNARQFDRIASALAVMFYGY